MHFNNINLGVKKCEYQHRDQQQATYTYNGTFIYYVNNFREFLDSPSPHGNKHKHSVGQSSEMWPKQSRKN